MYSAKNNKLNLHDGWITQYYPVLHGNGLTYCCYTVIKLNACFHLSMGFVMDMVYQAGDGYA